MTDLDAWQQQVYFNQFQQSLLHTVDEFIRAHYSFDAIFHRSRATADSGRKRKGFRGERENDSGVKTNGIPG